VKELSSTVAVFRVDRERLSEIAHASKNKQPMDRFKGRSTLKLIQSIKTVPSAFPTEMNTCGRMCVHPSGRFVVVSNRGHESITIFRVKQCNSAGGKASKGTLAQVGFFHTRGETPRHFQFDASGQILIVANQDSDTIAVFTFNLTSGEIKFSGNEYRVPSPNFICSCPMSDRYSDDDEDNDVPMAIGNANLVQNRDTNTTIPSLVEFDTTKKHSIQYENELQMARKEIDELKKQISILTNSTTTPHATPMTSPETTLTSDAARDLKDLFVDRRELEKLEEA
jgi:hypothetical protein